MYGVCVVPSLSSVCVDSKGMVFFVWVYLRFGKRHTKPTPSLSEWYS